MARSTCPSQKCKKLTGSEHFWTFRCRFTWQAQGIVHGVKSEEKREGFVAFPKTMAGVGHLKGQHFFWTSLHFFWTWTLVLDLATILLEMATILLDLHTLLLHLILPSCSTWPFPKPYPLGIDSPVSVRPRLHRNSSDSRALELR